MAALTVAGGRRRGRRPGAAEILGPARPRLRQRARSGALAAVVVFDVQSGSVGASIGGAVLALAAGAVAVLILMLFRNV